VTVPGRPKRDSWTVAIHAGETDSHVLGGGVVIDEWRVLTCWHVLAGKHGDTTPLWVAFPKAGVPRSVRRRVIGVRPTLWSAIVRLRRSRS
jgi:hypothetical protein